MLHGIAMVQWIKYNYFDKIFLTAKEWNEVPQQYVTEKIFNTQNPAINESVWYKTKFSSQILATNFGVFFL